MDSLSIWMLLVSSATSLTRPLWPPVSAARTPPRIHANIRVLIMLTRTQHTSQHWLAPSHGVLAADLILCLAPIAGEWWLHLLG